MSTREQFFVGANKAPTSLGTRTIVSGTAGVLPVGHRTTPTLNTSTYATVLSITGSGAVNSVCWYNGYGAPHSLDVKLTIDGTLLINATLSNTTTGLGVVVGTLNIDANTTCIPEPDLYFKDSLLIEAKDTSVEYSPVWSINYKVF